MVPTSATPESCPARVVDLAHRRWTLPLLAELHHARKSRDPTGARFVGLVHRLNVGRESLRQTLDFTIAYGWVRNNPGHGHPLRPEFILTPAGARLAPACADVRSAAAAIGADESIARKWTMPLLRVLGGGPARFGQIKAALAPQGATDRALSLALRALHDDRLVTRRVIHESPPGVLYRLTDRAAPLARAVAHL